MYVFLFCSDPEVLNCLLRILADEAILVDGDSKFRLEVRRGACLQDAIQMLPFCQDELLRELSITFTNESGVDDGGLRREFASLLVEQFASSGFLDGKNVVINN